MNAPRNYELSQTQEKPPQWELGQAELEPSLGDQMFIKGAVSLYWAFHIIYDLQFVI